MGEPTRDTPKHPKDSDQPSNPTKKRRINESHGSSSLNDAVEGVARSPSASHYRDQSDQEQPHYISERDIRPSPNENCASASCAAPTWRKPTSVNGKQDSLERIMHVTHPRGLNGTFNSPRDNNGHQIDYHLRNIALPHTRRHAVDQAAFMGRSDDSETSRRLQDALTLLSHSIGNSPGEYLNQGRRSAPESTYSHAASILPTMLPSSGDEASRLVSAAALRTLAGFQASSAASAPSSANVSGQPVSQLDLASSIPSYREALQLQQHNHDTESERLLARIRQSDPRQRQTHPYGQEGTYRGEQSYEDPVVRELRRGIPQLQEAPRYSGHLARREEDAYRANAASRQRANSFSVLSNGEPGTFSNRQPLPPMHTSAALLPPPATASIAQNTGEMSWRAPEAVVATRSPPVASISRLLSPNQFQAEECTAQLSGNNDCRGHQEWEEASRWCPSRVQTAPPLPPACVEGPLPPLSERTVLSLGIPDDEDWCSEFASFVRSDLVEVFRASGEDVADRINNKRIVWHQVGIRCRFCAHLPRAERARRATTFPSSIDRLQQSISTMTREHFAMCKQVPDETKSLFKKLQENQCSSSSEKRTRVQWNNAAKQLGLVNGIEGIMFHTDVTPQGLSVDTAATPEYQALVGDDDRRLVPDHLYFLMSQAERIRLSELDRRRNGQHSLPLGMAGFGCRHCSQAGISIPSLSGQNRIFPRKLRQLPTKANHFHEHLQQCEQCPNDIKACMYLLKSSVERQKLSNADKESEKKFFSRIFTRLHGNVPIGVPVDCHESTENNDLVDYLQKEEAAASE